MNTDKATQELLLSCSAVRSSSFAMDENDLAVFCISVVLKLTPCTVQQPSVSYPVYTEIGNLRRLTR